MSHYENKSGSLPQGVVSALKEGGVPSSQSTPSLQPPGLAVPFVKKPLRAIKISNLHHILTGLQILADIFTILVSFYLGHWAWNTVGPYFAPHSFQTIHFQQYYFSLGVALVTCLVGFGVNGLYRGQRSLLNIREFEIILKTCLIGCGITLAILFLAQEPFFSRGVFVLTWCSIIGLMVSQRYFFFLFQNNLRTRGIMETTTLIYGAGVVGYKLQEKFQQSPKLGYHVVGFIDDNNMLASSNINSAPILGGFDKLGDIIRQSGAQKLFIAMSQVPKKVIADILKVCRKEGCEFQIVPSLYDIVVQRVKMSEVDGIPLIGMSEPTYSLQAAFFKRVFDLFASLLLFILLSPALLFIAVVIKLTSRGPVLFRQKRIGKGGKRFVFFKFRSMRVNSPIYALTPSHGNDNRITAIGRFLRRTSLDELPQLINVIKGDMSLVGPRPEMPFIVAKYNDLQRQRLNVKPGITGLWQISADRKFAIHENMDYDIYYINNQSFLLDIAILFRTVFSCIRGIGAF